MLCRETIFPIVMQVSLRRNRRKNWRKSRVPGQTEIIQPQRSRNQIVQFPAWWPDNLNHNQARFRAGAKGNLLFRPTSCPDEVFAFDPECRVVQSVEDN